VYCAYRAVKPNSVRRKAHFRARVHKERNSADEWRVRVVIGGLREAHKEGKY
jgi:hypothetical protein